MCLQEDGGERIIRGEERTNSANGKERRRKGKSDGLGGPDSLSREIADVMSSALCGVINHISRQKKAPCRIGEEKDYEYYKREIAHVRL